MLAKITGLGPKTTKPGPRHFNITNKVTNKSVPLAKLLAKLIIAPLPPNIKQNSKNFIPFNTFLTIPLHNTILEEQLASSGTLKIKATKSLILITSQPIITYLK